MKIIITILVVLLGLGGGAYYAQDSGLYDFKELKQYIPSQVQELLNIEADTQLVSNSSDELEIISDAVESNQNQQDFGQESPFDNQNIEAQQAQQQQMQQQAQQQQQQQQMQQSENMYSGSEESNSVKSAAEAVTEKKEQLSSKINQGIQTAMLEKPSVAPQEKSAVQVLDASPEEMKMVNELNKIESKIVKLDNEKEDLETRYNKMIRKNRELAMKIKEIDLQIKAIDSQ